MNVYELFEKLEDVDPEYEVHTGDLGGPVDNVLVIDEIKQVLIY